MKEMILNNAKNEGDCTLCKICCKMVNQWRHGICAEQC